MAERGNRSESDIVVVGAGTAGLTLALCAARSGAQVRVLEKADRIGGTLFLTSGMFSAGGSRLQKERGIEDSPQGHYDDVIRISRHGSAGDGSPVYRSGARHGRLAPG